MTPLDELLRQARRLRFADAALETRFREERQAEGLLRSRLTAVVALLYVAIVGWNQARRVPELGPAFVDWGLHYRFLVVVPIWLLLLVSTALPGHLRRAEWVYGGATVGALWGLVLMGLGYRVNVSALTVDFALVLLTSVIVLPMCIRAVVTTIVIGVAGAVAWVFALVPAGSSVLGPSALNFTLAASVAVAVGWGRERQDRSLFAQREHVRALNAALEKSNAELARLNAEKNEFMAVAAHDLRAPLGTVRGLLELLRDGQLGTDEKRSEAIVCSHAETERMLALVNDYLGAHIAESGALPVRLARVDLGAAAAAVAARHAVAAQAKAQTLEVEAPAGRVWVHADEALLAQVSDNFLSNAIKFSPPGAPVRVELHVAEDGGAARLAVIDAGPGIAAEDQGRLFCKFGRLGHKPTGGEASTGLGLAVAKRLAEAMGGAVGCESAQGRGATFWIELPQET